MTEQTVEQTQKPTDATLQPDQIADVLSRIDALLDELYALRQIVLHGTTSEPEIYAGDDNAIQESVAELAIESPQTVPTPQDEQAFITPMADAGVHTAAKAAWEKVYTNAEIADMRSRGEEIPPDLVSQLSGSLAPTSPDERDCFTSFDLAWGRFSE